jgi:hypothetical protein
VQDKYAEEKIKG